MDLFQKCQDYTRAKLAIKLNVYPYFHYLNSGQDSEVIMEGKRTLMFGSNNYLGLTSDPRVKEAAIKAIGSAYPGCTPPAAIACTASAGVRLCASNSSTPAIR